MKNELNNLGKSLGKDAKESGHNTRRISANLPQIERKLDIISNAYNFTMDLPLTPTSNIASLNIYIRPDNCCECEAGALNGLRKGTGDVTRFEDIDGTAFIPNQPADSPYSGIEYRGVITSWTTVGTLDSIWFAWPGYPFFYPNAALEEDFNDNSYGDLTLTSEGTVMVPTGGVYNIVYHGHASGTTTDTSKVTVMLKSRDFPTIENPDPSWQTISKEVRYTVYGSLEPNAIMVALDLTTSAICYGLALNGEISVWVAGENVTNLNYSNGTIQVLLVGQGYGQVTGYVFHDAPASNPIEGASVSILLPGMLPVLTDATGKYTITSVIPGIHTIQATYLTFSQSQKVSVERNQVTANINFIL